MRPMLHLAATILCSLLLTVPVQAAPDEAPSEAAIYGQYRQWATSQQPPVSAASGEGLARYRAFLVAEGLTETEIERHLKVLSERGQRLEVEMWNRILTSPTPRFPLFF